MIQARIVEILDDTTHAYRESVQVAFDYFEVSFYLAGNTESRALVAALEAVKTYEVTAKDNAKVAPAPKPAEKPVTATDLKPYALRAGPLDSPPMLDTVYQDKGPSQEA